MDLIESRYASVCGKPVRRFQREHLADQISELRSLIALDVANVQQDWVGDFLDGLLRIESRQKFIEDGSKLEYVASSSDLGRPVNGSLYKLWRAVPPRHSRPLSTAEDVVLT